MCTFSHVHDVLESNIAQITMVLAILSDGLFGCAPEVVCVNNSESLAKIVSELHSNLVVSLFVDLVFLWVAVNAFGVVVDLID